LRSLPGGPAGRPQLFGAAPGGPSQGGAVGQAPPGAAPFFSRGGLAFGGGRGRLGGQFGDDRSIAAVLGYVTGHGGGTIVVSSQSSAAAAIIDKNANVAGIGGFSGRESDVSVAWLAQEVRSGTIRWVLAERSAGRPGLPGDTRVGAKPAMSAVASACRSVPMAAAAPSTSSGSAPNASFGSALSTSLGSASSTLYDCEGRAAALVAAGRSV
jgi:hypothetical protein